VVQSSAHFANIGWLDFKMMGVGLAAAILSDATIIKRCWYPPP
jgi:hypothetical protein